jgi:hypothetical protein
MLKVNLIIEEFYRSSDNIEHARTQAQEFLAKRLKSLYPDMSREESAAMQEQGQKMLEAVEQKIVAEREASGVTVTTTQTSEEVDGDGISAEEEKMGC